MNGKELTAKINSPRAAEIFAGLYGPENTGTARKRFNTLIAGIEKIADNGETFAAHTDGDLRIFSAPGRTELAGNHTDHNHGKALAASIQLDCAAVVCARKDNTVFFRSTGYPDVTVRLAKADGKPDTAARPEETGTTEALARGIAGEMIRRGTAAGGFSACADSTVLPGSGLSSSAAVEVLIGRIFDCLYGDGKRNALEIAQIGQIAENAYFGKPCGLLDQTACASGGAVVIDFSVPQGDPPRTRRINFDLAAMGYALCVVNSGGSHAGLTPDYAAIPTEMKSVAAFFGKTVLAEIDRETALSAAAALRKAAGDRALLRALHFFDENERVEQMAACLDAMNSAAGSPEQQHALSRYLRLVNESGDSSWELLQNVSPPHSPGTQAVCAALALSRDFFRRRGIPGVCRVHGGGFAGTIQTYVPLDALPAYREYMENIFGAASVTELRIRPQGAEELIF